MNTFPNYGAAWAPVHDDTSPVIQGGVCSDINGKKSVHWIGRLSELAAGGRKIKFPKGYAPTGYAVEAKPLVDPVGIYGTGVGLAVGASVALSAANKATSTVFTGATIAGPTADGSDSDSDYDTEATYGVVAKGATSVTSCVDIDDEYFAITATSSGTTLDRKTNDCMVNVCIWIDQVYPAVEFNH